MSKPANKTMIGAFVVGAVALAVVAIVLFGSGKFFRKTSLWLTFFQGSVRGLNVGSPVLFRGVQIGQVTDIIVGFDAAQLNVLIPVLFEVDPDKFKDIGDGHQKSEKELHSALIKEGLRAQLQMQSLVTGQLLINIDFFPDTPVKLIGMQQFKDKSIFEESWEIPSIPTPLQELEKALSKINIKEIAEDVRRAMNGIAKLATDPDLHEGIGVLKNTLTDIQKLARNLDSKVEPLATSFEQTLGEARAGIGDARKLINEQAAPMLIQFKQAAELAKTSLDDADTTLKTIENLAVEGSQLRYEVSAALKEIAAAARSVRVLADFIEQHPDALIRGRAIRTGGN
jgi:phospholipid/cholesterol/gamma-HCH transport system substrate-binding protein